MATIAIAAFAFLILNAPQSRPEPPRIVSMSPASGSSIEAGAVTVSITFDQPMRPRSYSFVMLDPATYPDCARVPRQSADGRTFLLDCRVSPGRRYAIGFNLGRFRNFVSADGAVSAQPETLRFTTR